MPSTILDNPGPTPMTSRTTKGLSPIPTTGIVVEPGRYGSHNKQVVEVLFMVTNLNNGGNYKEVVFEDEQGERFSLHAGLFKRRYSKVEE